MEDGTKQHIITPSTGLSNIPSDFACDDNATVFTDGVRNVDGELKAIQGRSYANTGDSNYLLVFVHEYCGAKRLIYRNISNNYLYWASGDNTPTNRMDVSKTNFERIVAVGATLVILHSGHTLSYATWNGSGYSITSQDSHPKYMFRLSRVSGRGFSGIKNTSEDNYKAQGIDHENGCFRTDNPHHQLVVRDNAYDTCVNVFQTLRNELLEDVYERRHFVFPFFAVAAIKLYDGTYKYIGQPQLMLTFAKGPSTIYYYPCCYNEDWDGIDTIRASLIGEWDLKFTQDIDLSSMVATVNGVSNVESIDIFVTHPVQLDEFYDGEDEKWDDKQMWRKATYQATYNGVVDRKILFDNSTSPSQSESKWPAECDLQFDWGGGDNSNKDYWESTYDPYHAKDDATIKDELIASLGQFRKIASIPYGQTNNGKLTNVSVSNYMKDSTLKTLDNQDLLTFSDEYDDWCAQYPDDINAINRRLLKIGGRQSLFTDHHIWESTYMYNSSAGSLYDIEITLQTTDGKKVIWQRCDDRYLIIDRDQMWFYYPDPRALLFTIWLRDGTQYISAQNFQHDAPIGGSYYFAKYPTEKLSTRSLISGGRPSTSSNNDTTGLDNRIAQSPVDNVFNDETKQYVGQGDIIKVASLTTALTQDAYKVSTVIAFTSQGVWSITCGDDGTFTSVSPAFSREVCINKNSVVMTDNKVYFASRKGLMCIVATAEEGVSAVVPKFSYEGTAVSSINASISPDSIYGRNFPVGDVKGKPLYDFYAEIASSGMYVYDYYTQSILMLLPGREDYLLYDMNSGAIFYNSYSPAGDRLGFQSAVGDYPDAYLVMGAAKRNCKLSSLELRHNDASEYAFCIVSRPLKLGGALYLKSLRRVKMLSSKLLSCDLKILGTNDLSQKWHILSSLGGKPYKYYIYVLEGTMSATDSIAGLMLETQIRYTDKPH